MGIWAAILFVSLTIALVATARARRARAEADRLAEGAALAGHARERLEGLATAIGRPTLAARLSLLRAHLPPDALLVEAGGDGAGRLAIALDTADPDALRADLDADSVLSRFRERGQERREGGVIRVRLSGPAE